MPVGVSTLIVALLAFPQAEGVPPRPDVRTIQFAIGTPAQKKHVTVRHNELTFSEGAGGPYVSSINLGEFEAQGEISARTGADATLVVDASVDPYLHAKAHVEVPLADISGKPWQTMRVLCADGHLTVSVGDVTIAQRDVPREAWGRLGFDVRRGELSLRGWQVLRRDSGSDPRVLVALNPDLGLNAASLRDVRVPRLVRSEKPQYTTAALRAKIDGEVELDAIVELDGTVSGIRVVHPLDDGLDQKAVDALRQWRFEPATLHGQPVRLRIDVVLDFTLR